MFGCSVNQDEQIQKRFYLYNEIEDRYFEFEAVLDSDFSDWFYAIESNIEVFFLISTLILVFGRGGRRFPLHRRR